MVNLKFGTAAVVPQMITSDKRIFCGMTEFLLCNGCNVVEKISREIEKGLTQIPRPASYTNYFSFLLHLAYICKGKRVVSAWIFPSEFCYSFHVRLICLELNFFNLFLAKRAFKKFLYFWVKKLLYEQTFCQIFMTFIVNT